MEIGNRSALMEGQSGGESLWDLLQRMIDSRISRHELEAVVERLTSSEGGEEPPQCPSGPPNELEP